MKRVVVLGGPGTGKTFFARRLAAAIGAPHIELDELWWQPGWEARSPESMSAAVDDATRGERWVADGFYVDEVGDLLWPRADTIVWLDLPRALSVRRAVRRSLMRALTRRELWNGNRESWSVLAPASVRRLWARWPSYPARIEARIAAGVGDARVVRLRTPAAAARWLATANSL